MDKMDYYAAAVEDAYQAHLDGDTAQEEWMIQVSRDILNNILEEELDSIF